MQVYLAERTGVGRLCMHMHVGAIFLVKVFILVVFVRLV